MRTLASALTAVALALPTTSALAPPTALFLAAPAAIVLSAEQAEARGRFGGRGGAHRAQLRSGGRHSVNRQIDRANINRDRDINRNRKVNRNIDVDRDIDRSRHVDIDVDHRYGCCWGGGAGFAAGVATTLAIGAIVSSLPSGCTSWSDGYVHYQRCGNTWYAPRYDGPDVVYVVVDDPR